MEANGSGHDWVLGLSGAFNAITEVLLEHILRWMVVGAVVTAARDLPCVSPVTLAAALDYVSQRGR